MSGPPPGPPRLLALLREVVSSADAIGGVELEERVLASLQLHAEPPDRLSGDTIGELIGSGHDIGELEVALLVGAEIVALLFGGGIGLPDQEDLETLHRLGLFA